MTLRTMIPLAMTWSLSMLFVWPLTVSMAQEPADKANAADSTSTGPAPAAADSKSESATDTPPAASDSADPVQRMAQLMMEWKELLGQLAKLQHEYKLTEPSKRKPIEEQYEKLMARGYELEPKLEEAAEAAYEAGAGDKEQEIGDFLAQVMIKRFAADDFDSALRIGNELISHDFWNKRVYSFAAAAAFNLGEFDLAERYFTDARNNRGLEVEHQRVLDVMPEYKAMWAKEREIREAEAKADDLPRVLFKTTKGDITVELFENEAPQTVANILSLVESGFYNGITFHRVIGGFMAQTGDPTGEGAGGPGYSIACECYEPDARMHFRGSLSMAHSGRDTGGSQFFMTFVPTKHLDGQHTVFGRVLDGMDVLQKITRREAQAGAATPDKIIEATVIRKRDHDYKFEKLPAK